MPNDYSVLKNRVAFLNGSSHFTSAMDSDGEEFCRVPASFADIAPQFKLNGFVWPGGVGFAVNFENRVGIHELYYAIDERTGAPAHRFFPPISPTVYSEKTLYIQGIDNNGDGVLFKFEGVSLFVPLTKDVIEQLKVGPVDGSTVPGRPFHPANFRPLAL